MTSCCVDIRRLCAFDFKDGGKEYRDHLGEGVAGVKKLNEDPSKPIVWTGTEV
jgi:hypothetical protein